MIKMQEPMIFDVADKFLNVHKQKFDFKSNREEDCQISVYSSHEW